MKKHDFIEIGHTPCMVVRDQMHNWIERNFEKLDANGQFWYSQQILMKFRYNQQLFGWNCEVEKIVLFL